jgi:hypothetical protein
MKVQYENIMGLVRVRIRVRVRVKIRDKVRGRVGKTKRPMRHQK